MMPTPDMSESAVANVDRAEPATVRSLVGLALRAVPIKVRRLAVIANVLALAGTVTASLLATPIYRSDALLVPKSSLSGGPDAAGNAQAALAGLGLSGGNAKLAAFEAIVKSTAVLDLFIQKSGIRDEIKRDYIEDYRDIVSGQFLIDVRKDGTITISAEHKEPVVAQRYLGAYISAFEETTRTIAERNARTQADMLERIVAQARSSYETAVDRVRDAPVDSALLRSDPVALSQALASLEARLLEGRIQVSKLEQRLAATNPDLIAAKNSLVQLLAAKERLVSAGAGAASGNKEINKSYGLDAALSRQHAVIVGVYTQAREKMLFDVIMASSPYAVAQQPTLPEKRIRPQRRKMIAFALMVQALLTIAVFGGAATLSRIRIPSHA